MNYFSFNQNQADAGISYCNNMHRLTPDELGLHFCLYYTRQTEVLDKATEFHLEAISPIFFILIVSIILILAMVEGVPVEAG